MSPLQSIALARRGSLLATLVLCVLPALADVTMGGNARAVAMGGAGLASGDAQGATALNPAFLAESGIRFGVQMPTFDARLLGANYGDVVDLLGKTRLDPQDALELATSLGDGPTQLDAASNFGVQLPYTDVSVEATLQARVEPNDEFRAWVREGGDPDDLLSYPDMQADLYAKGITALPSVAMGVKVPLPRATAGTLAVGVRLKPVQTYYAHYVIDGAAIVAHAPQLAPEMGGVDYLKRTSFSADLGLLYAPPQYGNLRTALVVNNLIEPKALDLPGVGEEQLAPRTISVGAAIVEQYYTLAADLVDLSAAYHRHPQFRAGGELRLPGHILALRGGYNSATGFTCGLGLGAFGIAYSDTTPIMVSQTIPW